MIRVNHNQKAFEALLRAGLFGKEVRLAQYTNIDYSEIYRLAEEQAVTGLVAAGIEHVTDVRVPRDTALQFVTSALQLEKRNLAMNSFVTKLIEEMRRQGIYAILVKGQGLAQCYERPLWRACGDVDLLLSHDNYQKTKDFLIPQASSVEKENEKALHCGMVLGQWVVELHGTLRSCCMPKMDKVVDEVQKDVFHGGNVRSWQNGQTQVFLPSFNNDVFFVFTHIIKHFFREGIGLRQVCDWCRLLFTCRESLDIELLKKRLSKSGVMTEWKAFAAFAVNYLGMPVEAMPLYSSEEKWLRKAEKINAYILSVGNFGHNRENIYKNNNYFNRKAKAFIRRISDTTNHLFIFPIDSIKVFFRTLYYGLIGFVKGIRR